MNITFYNRNVTTSGKLAVVNTLNEKNVSPINNHTQRYYETSAKEVDLVLREMNTTLQGLSESLVHEHRVQYGSNKIDYGKKKSLFRKLFEAFINPFTAILFILAVVSFITDVALAEATEQNWLTVIIITAMVMISGLLRFIQESRSGNAAERLIKMVKTTATVERMEKGKQEIPIEDLVVGDIVYLTAGDMVPADVRILKAKDLFVSQSALTGESEPIEKVSSIVQQGSYDTVTEYPNLAFMGSNVISGSATGVVIATGNATLFGAIAKGLNAKPIHTSFEKGVNSVSWVLIRFMLVMVPVVLFINGFTKGDWLDAFLFAISIAVGLTPEMLPMIVTASLAKGAVAMSKKKVIIKNLNSMQNFGAMDVLCTDKTGTLTQDKVILEYHLDVHGNEDIRVLRHAFLNSYYQTGLKNLMDLSIIERTKELSKHEGSLQNLFDHYIKVDEIPFDFERRRMSVVVADKNEKIQLITKGAVEEILSISKFAEYNGRVELLTEEIKKDILKTVDRLNDDGMRVIAVAHKHEVSPVGVFSVKDETDMVLIGYLAFLDPPKETTAAAIRALNEHGVAVKILTGDNERVTRCICKQVGLENINILLGSDIDRMSKEQLKEAVEQTDVFAKLSPQQKETIVSILRENGHVVGYMGDGINDANAMKVSDVGISVDTAVDIAKESAHVILLEKDLMVLENGIIEGRKTYGNMIKYIKMTASSNFGNVFSVLVASAFLPFLPMQAVHLILLNLIYDLSCTSLPWDNVDKEFLKTPRKWDASSIGKFMIWIGPTSSVFDITTYLLMYFVICPAATGGQLFHHITDPALQAYYIALFQAGWFVESMWTQTLVIHMIRTPKIPFIQSRASIPVTLLTFTGIAVLTTIPFTDLGKAIGLTPLPGIYFAWLALTIVCYMGLATLLKTLFVKRYGSLL
uniref:Magnesium-transporting ATPase, P-type 1 n=1 Tax=Gracilinema caldarium TaxID=215591 RepID=A0A7C3EFL7_9SPIR